MKTLTGPNRKFVGPVDPHRPSYITFVNDNFDGLSTFLLTYKFYLLHYTECSSNDRIDIRFNLKSSERQAKNEKIRKLFNSLIYGLNA